ncbi:hypothetical protein LX32DRAFT_342007 [Colletotrichum zoysiae]|uniref:Uncharacterized protein n=1 Tax=Colletotrichum zoysiae TaxID=1216348 RepID=A0AAD9HJC6_9PEZI|nr:hypothetical protein LX32DRAFT_342007 [Colletotrichum zoysiae]
MPFTWRHPPRCAGPDDIGASAANPPLPSQGHTLHARSHAYTLRQDLQHQLGYIGGNGSVLRLVGNGCCEVIGGGRGSFPPLTMQRWGRTSEPSSFNPLWDHGGCLPREVSDPARFETPTFKWCRARVSQLWEAHRRRHDANGNACLAWTSRFLSFTTKTATSSILDGNLPSNTFARDLYACAPHKVLIGQLDRRCNIFVL